MKKKNLLTKALVVTMLASSISCLDMPLKAMAAANVANLSNVITNRSVPATSIELPTPEEAITVGNTFQLTAQVKPDNATNKDVIWTSSDESVATVSDTGLVTAVKAGTATITVTLKDNNSIKQTAAIEVKNKVATPLIPNRGNPSTRPSASSGGSNVVVSNNTNSSVLTGSWRRDSRGWWFQTGSGYPRNRWGLINGTWYYFGNDGYMRTGWIQYNGAWYYLNQNSSEGVEGAMRTGWFYDQAYRSWFYLDRSGAMATGWIQVNGLWYYLNPISDGTRGVMATGWKQINGLWYYLNPISDGTRGAMAANTWIGNYYVGSNGAWIPSRTR